MLAGSTAATGTRVEGVPTAGALARAEGWALDGYRAGVAAITLGLGTFLLWHLHAWPPHEDETLAFFISRQPVGTVFDTVLTDRVVAPLVARLADRRTALLATLLVAVSWVTLLHAIYARMYSLFLFTSTLSFLLLLRALERGSVLRWALWGFATLALLATQPYGALVLGVQAAYVLVRRRRDAFPFRRALVAFAVVTVVALPLWRSYYLLASRFEVGFGDRNGSKLGSPVGVLEYLWATL